LVRLDKDIFELVPAMKNFIKRMPEIYINSIEKKVYNRLIYLMDQEKSEDELDKFINYLKFFNESEILTPFTMNVIRTKLEKNSKLTTNLYSFFFKTKL
jgi:hypothetical protein